MKLFELFESPILGGANNLKNIAQAATSGGNAEITLGNEPVTLEHPEARFIYGLYKRALQNGQQEQFMQALADPVGFHKLMQPMANMVNRDRGPEMAQAAAQRIGQPGMGESAGMRMMENTETLQHIINRFKHEVKNFMNGHDLSDDLYHALYDYYSDHGEMPYGVQKARDGDPFEWVHMKFEEDAKQYVTESVVQSVAEGWKDMMADVEKRAKDEKGSGKFDKKKNPDSGGTIYTRKYDAKTGETEDDGKDGSGEEKEKRGRGRPRTRPVADENTPRKGRGRPRKNPLPDANAPKRGRGRPKKVREWIETLRFVAEGSVQEASKWRDPKFKDKLYTQEPPEADQDDSEDVYYNRVKPDDYQGAKRSTFDRSKDTDKLHYPYGDYQVGKQAQVGDRAKKGLLTKNAIRVVKDRIKGTAGDHPTPKLPK